MNNGIHFRTRILKKNDQENENQKRYNRNFYDLVFPFDNLYELGRHYEIDPSEE